MLELFVINFHIACASYCFNQAPDLMVLGVPRKIALAMVVSQSLKVNSTLGILAVLHSAQENRDSIFWRSLGMHLRLFHARRCKHLLHAQLIPAIP